MIFTIFFFTLDYPHLGIPEMPIMIIPKTQTWWSCSSVLNYRPTGRRRASVLDRIPHQSELCVCNSQLDKTTCLLMNCGKWYMNDKESLIFFSYLVFILKDIRCPCWNLLQRPWLCPVKSLWEWTAEAFSHYSILWGMMTVRFVLWNTIAARMKKWEKNNWILHLMHYFL